MSKTLNFSELISQFDLGQFLTENKHLSAEKYLLSSKDNTKELNSLLAQQLNIYLKAKDKIPTFVSNHCWLTTKSYEQASSESSALFKSNLFSGEKMLDLSGGLGVDDWAFSKRFKQVISVDPDDLLNTLVKENNKRLHINTIERITSTAEDFLRNTSERFDLIYLDADRRTDSGKAFFLDQGKPNYLDLADQCALICSKVLLKLSPMIDFTYLKNAIPQLAKIWVVGNKNEVKEVLALVAFEPKNSLKIEAVIIGENTENLYFSDTDKEENNSPEIVEPIYFFEPHPCIIKSNLYQIYAKKNNLQLLASQSIYYYGDKIPKDFMGRTFSLVQTIEFSKTTVKQYLATTKIKKANISKRNFPLEVGELRKMFQLLEGGEDYLFFATNEQKEKLMFHCKKTD